MATFNHITFILFIPNVLNPIFLPIKRKTISKNHPFYEDTLQISWFVKYPLDFRNLSTFSFYSKFDKLDLQQTWISQCLNAVMVELSIETVYLTRLL